MTVGLNGRAGEWAIGRDGETAIGRSADQRFERSSLSDFALWSLMAGFHYGQAFSGEAATQDSLGICRALPLKTWSFNLIKQRPTNCFRDGDSYLPVTQQ
jgi:hypothetical protein